MAKNIYVKTGASRQRIGAAYGYDAFGIRTHFKAGYVYDENGDRQQFYPGERAVSLGVASSLNTALNPQVTSEVLVGTIYPQNTGAGNIGYREELDGDIVPMIRFKGGYIWGLYSNAGGGTPYMILRMNFPSDPGQNVFDYMGIPMDAAFYAASAEYSYSSGQAWWTWIPTTFQFTVGVPRGVEFVL